MSFRATIFLVSTVCVLQGAATTDCADVTFHITDLFGTRVSPYSLQVTSASVDFSDRFVDGLASCIRYGRYTVTVLAAGFNRWRDDVLIAAPAVLIPIGLETGQVEAMPQLCHLSGQVRGRSNIGAKDDWVRAQPVFGGRSISASVLDSRFELNGLPCGTYVITLISGQEVLATLPTIADAAHATVTIPVGNSRRPHKQP